MEKNEKAGGKTRAKMLSLVDHTLLKNTAAWEEIKILCDDAIACGCASVCIPPSYVARAKDYVAGRISICTFIGFPLGYQTEAVKVFETRDAIQNGADEIDMVINLGDVKEKAYGKIEEEIRRIKAVCGEQILKVIIETCDLTEEEKIRMCQVVTKAGADFIKTSTGFSKAGATLADVELFSKYVGEKVRIKAAGGIRDFDDAAAFVCAGARRLGTSRLVAICKE